jgi:hypothetical protein
MSGAIHPLPQYAFMAWCLIKHRDNFTSPLPFIHSYAASQSSGGFMCCDKIQNIVAVLLSKHNYRGWRRAAVIKCNKSCDSSVGIALGCGLDDWGSRVRFPAGARNFSLHHCVQNGSGGSPSLLSNDFRGLFPWG